MKIYIYDGSFEGLLTSIYEAYYKRETPQRIMRQNNLQYSLVDDYIHIETDFEKADKVYNSAINKISKEAVENAFYVYLSDNINSATAIYKYFKLGFKVGCTINDYISTDVVFNIDKIKRRVLLEAHRMKGLLRFVELKGEIYYAKISPDNNILMLLAPHFEDRLKNQNWIIHDVKRNIAAIYNKKEWVISDLFINDNKTLSEREELFQDMWKEYFKSISISERVNPRLQKSYMPVRYWKHLIEKSL